MRVTTRVRLADVAPTVLEAAGCRCRRRCRAVRCCRWLRRQASGDDRPVYAETDVSRGSAFGWSPLASWRNDRFLLRSKRRSPSSTTWLPIRRRRAISPAAAAAWPMACRRNSHSSLREVRPLTSGGERSGASDRGRSRGRRAAGGARIRRRVRWRTRDHRGRSEGSHRASPTRCTRRSSPLKTAPSARAIPLLEQVVRDEPDIPIAQLNLGIARARQRQYAQAIAPLTRAATLQPDTMIAGTTSSASRLLRKRRSQRRARRIRGRRPPARMGRRALFAGIGLRADRSCADAINELRAALALEPRHFRANLLLGRILTLQNQGSAALPHLRTAVDVDPRSAEAFAFLADAYDKVGNSAEAAKARQRARDLSKK